MQACVELMRANKNHEHRRVVTISYYPSASLRTPLSQLLAWMVAQPTVVRVERDARFFYNTLNQIFNTQPLSHSLPIRNHLLPQQFNVADYPSPQSHDVGNPSQQEPGFDCSVGLSQLFPSLPLHFPRTLSIKAAPHFETCFCLQTIMPYIDNSLRTPQNTPATSAPINSRARAPGLGSLKEGLCFMTTSGK